MGTLETRTLLDDLVPDYDVASRHGLWIAAPPHVVYRVARSADLGRPWLVRLLMGMRALPARLATGSKHRSRGISFTVVAEAPGFEVVLGILGRFWTPSGQLVAACAEQFRVPPPPGLAQALWNFRIESEGLGTRLTTETRVRCADAATRRRFFRYWRVIRFGSGWIRLSTLRSIRRIAEASSGRTS